MSYYTSIGQMFLLNVGCILNCMRTEMNRTDSQANAVDAQLSRREFLQVSGGAALGLALKPYEWLGNIEIHTARERLDLSINHTIEFIEQHEMHNERLAGVPKAAYEDPRSYTVLFPPKFDLYVMQEVRDRLALIEEDAQLNKGHKGSHDKIDIKQIGQEVLNDLKTDDQFKLYFDDRGFQVQDIIDRWQDNNAKPFIKHVSSDVVTDHIYDFAPIPGDLTIIGAASEVMATTSVKGDIQLYTAGIEAAFREASKDLQPKERALLLEQFEEIVFLHELSHSLDVIANPGLAKYFDKDVLHEIYRLRYAAINTNSMFRSYIEADYEALKKSSTNTQAPVLRGKPYESVREMRLGALCYGASIAAPFIMEQVGNSLSDLYGEPNLPIESFLNGTWLSNEKVIAFGHSHPDFLNALAHTFGDNSAAILDEYCKSSSKVLYRSMANTDIFRYRDTIMEKDTPLTVHTLVLGVWDRYMHYVFNQNPDAIKDSQEARRLTYIYMKTMEIEYFGDLSGTYLYHKIHKDLPSNEEDRINQDPYARYIGAVIQGIDPEFFANAIEFAKGKAKVVTNTLSSSV